MKNLYVTLTVLVLPLMLWGQGPTKPECGYSGLDPWFVDFMENRENYDFDYPEETVWVPLAVHILGDDDGNGFFPVPTLFRSLCQLNLDFAATNMQFYVPEPFNYISNSDYYEHSSFGVGQDMMRRNNRANRVNCYIVGDPAGTCGYYSGGGNAVALSKSCNGPSDHTWAHELGHFFSLPHTFVGWEGTDYEGVIPGGNRRGVENVARDNCSSTADRFCDTPADYLSFRWTCTGEQLSSIIQTDPSGTEFQSDGTLFMSYANDACMNRFSSEQMDAMNINLRTRRNNLLVDPTPLEPITEELVQLSPIGGEAAEFDNAVLKWAAVENATGYYVRISRIPTLSGLFEFEGVVEDTQVVLPELVIGRRYFWRVQAFNEFDYCTNPTSIESFIAAELTSNNDLEKVAFNVFPNPVSSNIQSLILTGMEFTSQPSYHITSADGQIVQQGELKGSQINLNRPYARGVYTLILYTEDEVGSQKIIIQ